MKCQQVTERERYILAYLFAQGKSVGFIARELKRHRSTIYRELARNRCADRAYRPYIAQQRTTHRLRTSRQRSYFAAALWDRVKEKLYEEWSPEQISLKLKETGESTIHWETIYRYIWRDRERNGILHCQLRQHVKQRRKRYRAYDSRGVLAGKRHISARPEAAKARREGGHFEVDLVLGNTGRACILTLVDRKSRYTVIRKLRNKTVKEVNAALIPLVQEFKIKTLTADNGCEFHGYKGVEEATGSHFYFATPHHSWERGTIENTNGLIRQYLPKSRSMRYTTQSYCDFIAKRLNTRPRKILNLKTPEESHHEAAA